MTSLFRYWRRSWQSPCVPVSTPWPRVWLLQAFALTVGIGRIIENPVKQAIAVLLASDAEGQGRVREALSSWPLSLRRRISVRLWRVQRDERARQIAEGYAAASVSQIPARNLMNPDRFFRKVLESHDFRLSDSENLLN